MDHEVAGPFVLGTLPWMPRPLERRLAVIVKATFVLTPGELREPAREPDPMHDELAWEHGSAGSVYAPSDHVPLKQKADVLLVGSAHAPGGAAVERLTVRLTVGSFSKALRVLGDRVWIATPDGPRPSRPQLFADMPLRYERAARQGDNPVGLPLAAASAAPGQRLPNIEVDDGAESPVRTPGFGPLPLGFRASRTPSPRDTWHFMSQMRLAPAPLPPQFDQSVFNSAPRDQQLAALSRGDPITLENLHPRHARFETRLPARWPAVLRIDSVTGASTPVPLRCDTLWIDTDREICVITWRGTIEDPKDHGADRLRVLEEPPGTAAATPAWAADAQPRSSKKAGLGGLGGLVAGTVDITTMLSQGPALPFEKPAESSAAEKAPLSAPPSGPPISATPAAPVSLPASRSPAPPASSAPASAVPASAAGALSEPRPAWKGTGTVDLSTVLAEKAASQKATPFAGETPPSAPQDEPAAPSVPDLSIETCARIAAAIAHEKEDAPSILKEHDLTEETWKLVLAKWEKAVDDEIEAGKAALLQTYDAAYVAEIERLRGPIGPVEYACIAVAAERGAQEKALSSLDLPAEAAVRVERIFIRRMVRDRAFGALVRAAISEARSTSS